MKRNPNAAVAKTAVDRTLPPFLEVQMGSAVECCRVHRAHGTRPERDVCDCRCHVTPRIARRLLHNIDGRDSA